MPESSLFQANPPQSLPLRAPAAPTVWFWVRVTSGASRLRAALSSRTKAEASGNREPSFRATSSWSFLTHHGGGTPLLPNGDSRSSLAEGPCLRPGPLGPFVVYELALVSTLAFQSLWQAAVTGAIMAVWWLGPILVTPHSLSPHTPCHPSVFLLRYLEGQSQPCGF